jgi:hypothetical protein
VRQAALPVAQQEEEQVAVLKVGNDSVRLLPDAQQPQKEENGQEERHTAARMVWDGDEEERGKQMGGKPDGAGVSAHNVNRLAVPQKHWDSAPASDIVQNAKPIVRQMGQLQQSMEQTGQVSMPWMEQLQHQLVQLEAENAVLVTNETKLRAENARVVASSDRIAASLDRATAEVMRLTGKVQELEVRLDAQCSAGFELDQGGLSPEYEELRAKFELLEQMYQPVQTENEQRKQMLADMRKAALEISKSRLDLDLPTKRMGELDSAMLHRLGVEVEGISLLQDTVCNPNFYPWSTRQVKQGSDEVETVANWEDTQLKAMVHQYASVSKDGSGGRGREVAEEVLMRNKELLEYNPSGGYCVTIPYHHGEGRELKPEELLKLAVGIDVFGCRLQSNATAIAAAAAAATTVAATGRREAEAGWSTNEGSGMRSRASREGRRRQDANGRQQGKGPCFNCGEIGHVSRGCAQLRQDRGGLGASGRGGRQRGARGATGRGGQRYEARGGGMNSSGRGGQ